MLNLEDLFKFELVLSAQSGDYYVVIDKKEQFWVNGYWVRLTTGSCPSQVGEAFCRGEFATTLPSS